MINIIIDKQGRPSKSSIFLGNQHENLDETLQFFFPKEYEDHYRYIAYCYKDRRTGKKITGISPLVEDAFKVTSAITKCAGMWQLYVICKTTQIDEKATIIDLTANNSTGEHIFISDAINGRISGNEIDIEAFENIAVDENIKILYDEILSLKLRVEKNEETRQSQENTMTDLQKKMMDKLGLSKDDFEPINKDRLLEEAYLKCEYNSILIEQLMGG